MNLVPFFCALTMGFALLAMRVEAITPSTPFVSEEEIFSRSTMNNGVKIYLHKNDSQPHFASFRIVLKTIFCDQLIYAFDSNFDSLESIGQFFSYCESKIKRNASTDSKIITQCSYSDFYIPHDEEKYCPEEVAIIAVGDFPVGEMRQMIENYFGHLELPIASPRTVAQQAIYVATDPLANKVALDISYPSLRHPISNLDDLIDEWKYLILQDLFQERMKNCIKGFNESWVHSYPRFVYPVPGYAMIPEEISENVLSSLLWQIEMIKMEGFSQDEFNRIKHRLVTQIEELSSSNLSNNVTLASFYVDQYILGSDNLSFTGFLYASKDLLKQIQYADLEPVIPMFLADTSRSIHIIYPKSTQQPLLTVIQIKEIIEKIVTLGDFYQYGAIRNEPKDVSENSIIPLMRLVNAPIPSDMELATVHSSTHSTEAFYQLPLPDREQRLIYDVIKTMGDKNVLQLLFEKKSLERKGRRINHVHPLRFVGYILATPKLKSSLREVKTSTFKWDHFIDGFAKRMKEEASYNNLTPYLPGFVQYVGADLDEVKQYVQRKDWEGLVKSLL